MVTLHHRLDLRGHLISHTGTDQRAAAANAFGINVGVVFAMPRILERTDDTAGGSTACRTDTGAGYSRREPAGSDNRSKAGNCHQAKARQQAADAAKQCACGGAAVHVAMVVDVLDVVIMAGVFMASVGIRRRRTGPVAQDAQIVVRDTKRGNIVNGAGGIVIAIEQSGNGLCHEIAPELVNQRVTTLPL